DVCSSDLNLLWHIRWLNPADSSFGCFVRFQQKYPFFCRRDILNKPPFPAEWFCNRPPNPFPDKSIDFFQYLIENLPTLSGRLLTVNHCLDFGFYRSVCLPSHCILLLQNP